MIYTFIFAIINGVLGSAVKLLHLPTVTTLPFVDSYLTTGMGYFAFIVAYIPPLGTIYVGFLWIMLFKITLWTLRQLHVLKK